MAGGAALILFVTTVNRQAANRGTARSYIRLSNSYRVGLSSYHLRSLLAYDLAPVKIFIREKVRKQIRDLDVVRVEHRKMRVTGNSDVR